MDKNSKDTSGTAHKKTLKFKPRVPPSKSTKPAISHTKPPYEAENVVDSELLKKLKLSHEDPERRFTKAPKMREPTEVAFGYFGEPTTVRSFGISGSASRTKHEGSLSNNHEPSSNINTPFSADGGDLSGLPSKKEYVQPSKKDPYHPVILPWRRPDARDPEMLDEEEFGQASISSAQDETCIKPAEELGLLEGNEGTKMLFFQLPASLPSEKRSAVALKGKEIKGQRTELEGCNLQELPAGFMGKMLVYKSGIIKMMLGDTLFDVSPGVDCTCAQDVAAINTEEKHCCILGNIDKRAVVTPDVDSLLDSKPDSD